MHADDSTTLNASDTTNTVPSDRTERRHRGNGRRIITIIIASILIVGVVRGARILHEALTSIGLTPGVLRMLVFDTGEHLLQEDGRTNVLFLGVREDDGARRDILTDTMLVLSVDQKNRSAGMISIPRDIWSETLQDKVNSAYHYGEQERQGDGDVLAKAVVEEVVGLPLFYTVVVDFVGFETFIDTIGGVEVDVPQAFTDTEFPIAGREEDDCDGDLTYACRYEAVSFEKGRQYMDGATALTYVRSRHASGEEGTDFARGKRQQAVMVALREKLFDRSIWSVSLAQSLYDTFRQSVDTNMTLGEMLVLGKVFMQIPSSDIRRISIETLLTAPPLWQYGRYVLVPSENFSVIHTYIQEELEASL